MADTDLRALFERYVATLNTHDFQRLGEFMHDDLIVNGQPMRRDAMIVELEAHIAAVPDLVWQVEDIAVDGERVAARFFNSGTPVQDWLGAKANGATVAYAEFTFHRVRDGRFYEQNFLLDAWSVQKQLG